MRCQLAAEMPNLCCKSYVKKSPVLSHRTLTAYFNLSSFTVAGIAGGEREEQLQEAIVLAILQIQV